MDLLLSGSSLWVRALIVPENTLIIMYEEVITSKGEVKQTFTWGWKYFSNDMLIIDNV